MNEDIPAINSSDAPEDRRVAIISHLSMEVKLLITNSHTFRVRSAYTLWIGPFLILGAILFSIKSEVLNIGLSDISYTAIAFLVLSYLALGIFGGFMEMFSWRQIKRLRIEIIKLSVEDIDEQKDLIEKTRNKLMETYYLPLAYTGVFLLVLLSVISLIRIVSSFILN